MAFLEAAAQADRRRTVAEAVALRMAQVEEKHWKAYMKELRRGG